MKKISLIISIFLMIGGAGGGLHAASPKKVEELRGDQPVTFTPRDFSHLIGMQGFNEELLRNHFTLYNGYVRNANLILETLRNYIFDGKTVDYQYQALKRRLGWEMDGVRLHEYYFENLGGKKSLNPASPLFDRIKKSFGSFENWRKDFVSTGMMRGIGWAILYYDPVRDQLLNLWINEHDLGHLAGGKILLVMDVWEHAFMTQYGLDRAKYIDAFFNNIDWEIVMDRVQFQGMPK